MHVAAARMAGVGAGRGAAPEKPQRSKELHAVLTAQQP